MFVVPHFIVGMFCTSHRLALLLVVLLVLSMDLIMVIYTFPFHESNKYNELLSKCCSKLLISTKTILHTLTILRTLYYILLFSFFLFFFFPLLNSSSLNAIAVMPVVQRSVKGPMWLHFLIGVSTFLLSDLLWLRAIAKSVSKYFWILDSYGHSFGVIEIVRVCTILVNIRYWHCSLTWGIKKKLFCTNIRVPTL